LKKLILILIIVSSFIGTSFAQKFPFVVKPTYKLTIETPKGNFEFPQDTLWLLKHSQYKVAIQKAKELELSEQQVAELKSQVADYKKQGAEKTELITVLKKDRDFYEDNLADCKKDVLKINKKGKRQRLYTKIAIICIPVAAAIGFGTGAYLFLGR